MNIQKKKFEEDHADLTESYNRIGKLYKAQKNYEEAFDIFEQAFKIRKYHLGKEHPDVADSLY